MSDCRTRTQCKGHAMTRLNLILIVLFFGNLFAQLSPGDLSRVHEQLEGLKNCTKCHAIGQKIASEKCLDCHIILKERIDQKKGLHANNGFQECEKCHVEHQGRDFNPIYWEGGKEKFDHRKTGFSLEGKHTELKCEKCHQPQFIAAKTLFEKQKKNLNRTFLGLDQECMSCHRDEHRGQFTGECLNCHTMEGWKPASRFDHNKARFTLTGKHRDVKCEKCHPQTIDNKFPDDPGFLKFAGLEFNNCVDCHKDVHNNKFGKSCTKCHNTNGWKQYNSAQFSHERTHFPLKGKHINVPCEKCHLPNRPLTGLKYQNCSDCHRDYHLGVFAQRQRKGACEECHTVDGFTPSTFTVEMHNQTDYPLKGGHLAVPCIACHKKVNRNTAGETIQFLFKSNNCRDCHKDPHSGTVDKYVLKNGCRHCHQVESWRQISFDHNKTDFPLQGKHLNVSCTSCHKTETDSQSRTLIRFVELNKNCRGCHADAHHGQFAVRQPDGSVETQCEKCHTPRSWLAEKFDHNRDASFKLEGAHRNVKCTDCHPTIADPEKPYIRYKPLKATCSSCHGTTKTQEDLNK